MTAYLRPTGPMAPDALLPGDPKRAMELATKLLERPLMSNLNRGLWGYTGMLRTGRRLTVQSTGIGGPSAAAVLQDLVELGVERAIRIGTCVSLDPALPAGGRLLVREALASDGVSAALGSPPRALPDAGLTNALARGLPAEVKGARVATSDLRHEQGREERSTAWREAGAQAMELCAAPLLALGPRLGARVACVLVVAEGADDGTRLADDELDRAALALGEAAARVLVPQPAPDTVSSG